MPVEDVENLVDITLTKAAAASVKRQLCRSTPSVIAPITRAAARGIESPRRMPCSPDKSQSFGSGIADNGSTFE